MNSPQNFCRSFDLILLAAFAVCIFFYGIEGRTLRRASEGRVARVAQEMLDRGDWVVPHLNGKPRYQKPPLASWLVALSAKVFGREEVTVVDALLPSAAAAALAVLLAYLWLTRRGSGESRAAGAWAAVALASMPAFFLQARTAELDMVFTLLTVLCFFAWERHRLGGRGAPLLLFYVAMALGFLTKGHIILVIVIPPLVVWEIWRTKAGERGRSGSWSLHAGGLGLFLLIVLAWGIPFLLESGITWADFQKEGLDRFGERTGHKESLLFYFLNVPVWSLPWIALLPFIAWGQWRTPPDEGSARRWLWWLWFGVNLILFSIPAAKQRHYAVPWMAPLALIIGEGMVRDLGIFAFDRREPWAVWGRKVFSIMLLALGLGLPAVCYFFSRDGIVEPMYWLPAGLGAAFFLWAGCSYLREKARWVLPAVGAGILCAVCLHVDTWEAYVDRDRAPQEFCTRVRAAVPADAALYDVGIARPHILFFLGRNVTPIAVVEEAAAEEDRISDATIREVADRLRGERAFVLVPTQVRDRLPPEVFEEPIAGVKDFAGHERGAHLLRGRPASK